MGLQLDPEEIFGVAVVDVVEAGHIYELRETLEGLAGRLFASRASDAQIAELQGAMKQLSTALTTQGVPKKIRETEHFYEVLREGCGNPSLSDAILRLHGQIILLRASSISSPSRGLQSLDEMEAIVAAVRSRDPDAAETACITHVHAARDAALSTFVD